MKFRTSLLLAIALLVVGVLAATVGGVAAVLQDSARSDSAAELQRGARVFEELAAGRAVLHRAEARVVAEEPRLKAVVATEDVSHETIFGVAHELRGAVQSDLFLLTDGDGRLLADVLDPNASGFDMKGVPLVAAALSKGDAAGVWTSEGRVYEVHARRLGFGTSAVGVLVIGFALGDAVAEAARRQTGSAVAVLLDGRPVAASAMDPDAPADRAAIAAALDAVPTTTPDGAPSEVALGGARYLALAAPIRGYGGSAQLRYVVLRSLDRALAPAERVARVLYTIAAGALAAAALLAIALSRRLSRPLDGLVAFTEKIAAGNLDERAPPAGPIEVRALAAAMNRMAGELAASREELVAKERLEQELEIGARIQTSILPRHVDVEGLDIAARMVPASEVGGDYYDILPVRGCSWIGIGDVAGHGLRSGLVMLMVQSVVSALARSNPQASPRDALRLVNRVLYDNVRHRLGNDEHVTLTLLRYRRDGLVFFAGAHEEMLVCRAATGRCEIVPTPGPWVGAIEDIDDVTVEGTLQLRDGDVLLLYTDGILEARDASGHIFGLEPLVALVEAHRDAPVERIRDEIFDAVAQWSAAQDDDMTVVVLRYRAPEARLA